MRSRVFFSSSFLAILLLSPIRAQLPAAAPATANNTEAQKKAAEERIKQMQEIVLALTEKHGYKLAKGEPFKYIKDPQNEERIKLRRLMQSSTPSGGVSSTVVAEGFHPFMHVFYMLPDGRIVSSSTSDGVTTLGDVFSHVLQLKRHEFQCPSNLLLTYTPGDWVLLHGQDERPVMRDAAATALEKILNEQLNLSVTVKWIAEKRPALVLRGRYKANPKSEEGRSDSSSSEGSFGLIARRSHLAGTGGTYEDFKLAIGEALMLPVVDEAEVRPKNNNFVWLQSGEPTLNSDRLPAEQEELVLDSLHEQLGYDLSIEPREVRLLSIEPTDP